MISDRSSEGLLKNKNEKRKNNFVYKYLNQKKQKKERMDRCRTSIFGFTLAM
jgi:hypothetical protein